MKRFLLIILSLYLMSCTIYTMDMNNQLITLLNPKEQEILRTSLAKLSPLPLLRNHTIKPALAEQLFLKTHNKIARLYGQYEKDVCIEFKKKQVELLAETDTLKNELISMSKNNFELYLQMCLEKADVYTNSNVYNYSPGLYTQDQYRSAGCNALQAHSLFTNMNDFSARVDKVIGNDEFSVEQKNYNNSPKLYGKMARRSYDIASKENIKVVFGEKLFFMADQLGASLQSRKQQLENCYTAKLLHSEEKECFYAGAACVLNPLCISGAVKHFEAKVNREFFMQHSRSSKIDFALILAKVQHIADAYNALKCIQEDGAKRS